MRTKSDVGSTASMGQEYTETSRTYCPVGDGRRGRRVDAGRASRTASRILTRADRFWRIGLEGRR